MTNAQYNVVLRSLLNDLQAAISACDEQEIDRIVKALKVISY